METCVGQLINVLQLNDEVIDDGQIKVLKKLPASCHFAHNSNAFVAGFVFGSWEENGLRRRLKLIPLPGQVLDVVDGFRVLVNQRCSQNCCGRSPG